MSSSVRIPPPGRSAASTTCTRSPAAARRRAAASPLGPLPTTTASALPFTAIARSPRHRALSGSQPPEQRVGGAERVALPRRHLLGEDVQRRRAADVAHPLAQRGHRDRLDLPRRAGRPAAVPLPRGRQPVAVLGDRVDEGVDAGAGGGHGAADRRGARPPGGGAAARGGGGGGGGG